MKSLDSKTNILINLIFNKMKNFNQKRINIEERDVKMFVISLMKNH